MLGRFEKLVAKTFKYDKVIFMNSGVEAVETAMKFARRWGYCNKKIPVNKAQIVWASGNFHGRTIAVIGASDDFERYDRFGPFGKERITDEKGELVADKDGVMTCGLGQFIVPFGMKGLVGLEKCLSNPNCCAYIVEPI